ncbi:hypothetical protein [Parasitella parasitica]|uniref:HMG box domain-containing protein n=1 Tax=Parasitella parasitica TaxID=35722 RepID=A0A0B7NFL4_9FUNG|nr:hypothetical protein [Parasitella parasitica]
MSLIKAFSSLSIQSRPYVSASNLHPKKFTSILANIPVRPRNAWQFYYSENMTKYKLPNGRIDMKKGTTELGAAWKALAPAEKKSQIYQDKFESEAKAHDECLKEVLSKTTPEEFRKENALRKKYNMKPLRDPRRPKRAKGSFLLFLDHLKSINDPAIAGKDTVTQATEAGKKFKALSENERKLFDDKAKSLRDEYVKELKAYHEKYDN